MSKQDESLFLLEVLIDKILFVKSPCFSDKDFRTCVNFQFSSVETLEICDDESSSIIPAGGPFIKNFNSGKSCLFSLKEGDISSAMSKFPIKVTVSKSLPCGCLPTYIVMGECTIDMTKEFVQARKKYLENPNAVSFEALKDTFRITGTDGTVSGDIIMFLRISCFGKLIVTKFQGGQGAGPGAMMGAGGQSNVDRSCKGKKDFQTSQDPCRCGATAGLGGDKNACGGGICPIAKDPYNSMPCEETDDPCYCSGPHKIPPQQMACRNTDQYCLHVPKGRSKEYEEIDTNLNGNELKIKVPKNSSVIKKLSLTHCTMQRPYSKDKSNTECETPCGKNQISLALPSEATCCRGEQLQGTQFTCTTEGCTQASKHGHAGNMAKGDRPPDPVNRDSFVLKVAKTALQGDRKCKIELELVAPKTLDKKPPVQKLSRRAQCTECTCCMVKCCKPKRRYCCPTGNKIIFQMPSDICGTKHKQRTYFNFNSDGVGDVARDEPGQIVPQNSEGYSGVVYDFSDQVVKLRIGKTMEMPGRKSKLEYQFITPAISHDRVVPVKDTRTAQCAKCECCRCRQCK